MVCFSIRKTNHKLPTLKSCHLQHSGPSLNHLHLIAYISGLGLDLKFVRGGTIEPMILSKKQTNQPFLSVTWAVYNFRGPYITGVLIQWNGGMEWNGWNECCSSYTCSDDLILSCTSHLVTMIAIASQKMW